MAYCHNQQHDQAITYLQKCCALKQELPHYTDKDILAELDTLVYCYYEIEDYQKVKDLAQKRMNIENKPSEGTKLKETVYLLANAYDHSGDTIQAMDLYQYCLELAKTSSDTDDSFIKTVENKIAELEMQ